MSTQSVIPLSPAPNCAAGEPIWHSDFSGGALFGNTATIVSQQKRRLVESIKTYPDSGIISYAQNREDILLWRALHDVDDGFYVDVGAQDPSHDSIYKEPKSLPQVANYILKLG